MRDYILASRSHTLQQRSHHGRFAATMNDQLEGSSLEAALEFLRQRDTYRNRLLAELQALEARAEKIKSVLRELGPVDQPAEKTLMLKGQNGLRHKPPGLKDATIPE